ncbi:Fic family protein [Streptomyces californicus]
MTIRMHAVLCKGRWAAPRSQRKKTGGARPRRVAGWRGDTGLRSWHPELGADPALHPLDEAALADTVRSLGPARCVPTRPDIPFADPAMSEWSHGEARSWADAMSYALVDRYGPWTLGWRWAHDEGDFDGGPVGHWCCPRDSVTTPDETLDRVEAALREWREWLEFLARCFDTYPLELADVDEQRILWNARREASSCTSSTAPGAAAAGTGTAVRCSPGSSTTGKSRPMWPGTWSTRRSTAGSTAGPVPGPRWSTTSRSGWRSPWSRPTPVCPRSRRRPRTTCGAGSICARRWPGTASPTAVRRGRGSLRDGAAEDFRDYDAAIDPARAEGLLRALDLLRADAKRGARLDFALLSGWQRHVLDTPGPPPFRDAPAFAKGGRERYGIEPDTRARLDACLAGSAPDAGRPLGLTARAARAYLDVCFFHPFDDGNARSAFLALVFVLAREDVALDSTTLLRRVGFEADNPEDPLTLVRWLNLHLDEARRRAEEATDRTTG